MSTSKPGKDSVYVVAWPEHGVYKIGCSGVSRWRSFVSRGAEVLAVWEFDTSTDAYLVEDWLHQSAYATHRLAFKSVTPLAQKLLGNKGGGHAECFLGTADDARMVIDLAMRRALLDDDAQTEVRA